MRYYQRERQYAILAGMAVAAACLAGCQGLGTVANSPPDPSIAASPFWAIQSVNFSAPVAVNLQTNAGTSLLWGSGNDRRIYYNNYHHLWLWTGLTPGGIGYEDELGCTIGADPTGGYYVYHYPDGSIDMPSLGMAQNVAVVANRNGTWFAQLISNLEFGTGGIPWQFTAPYPAIESYAARSRDADLAFNYVVSAGGSGASAIVIQRLAPNLTVQSARIDTPTFDSGGIRVGGLRIADCHVVTFSPHDVYVGAGGHHLYVLVDFSRGADSCLRIMDFYDVSASPFAPTLIGSSDFCLAGADVWEGALAQNIDGTLYLVAHCSGPSLPISMCYGVWPGPGASPPVVIKKQGTVFSNVCRVGDYATASPWWLDGGHRILATTQIGFSQTQRDDTETWIDLIP